MVGRFLGKDIITIREAAWLTDNTYKYEDVVRMMGEVTATLQGQIRVCVKVIKMLKIRQEFTHPKSNFFWKPITDVDRTLTS